MFINNELVLLGVFKTGFSGDAIQAWMLDLGLGLNFGSKLWSKNLGGRLWAVLLMVCKGGDLGFDWGIDFLSWFFFKGELFYSNFGWYLRNLLYLFIIFPQTFKSFNFSKQYL